MFKHNDLWKPPADLVSNIYNLPSKKKKKKGKRSKKKPRHAEENREFLLNFFGLHKYSPNSAICHSICIKFDLEMPDQKSKYNKFIRKACSRLKNERRVEREYTSRFPTSQAFYNSQSWRDIRYIALKNSNGCCDLCGARATHGIQLHVDHIKPRSKYPQFELDLDNLQVLCGDCNFGKSNIDETNWKQHWDSI